MNADERQFLLTTVWMFMRHGRRDRARRICEALCEADPHDGTAAVALAELLVSDGEPEKALNVLNAADIPANLAHVEAVLETRTLRLLGKTAEANERWRRHLAEQKGANRKWIG